MARTGSGTLLSRPNIKLDSFLKRNTERTVYERIRAYEPCVVISETVNKVYMHVVLSDERVYLTEYPPRTLTTACCFRRVRDIELDGTRYHTPQDHTPRRNCSHNPPVTPYLPDCPGDAFHRFLSASPRGDQAVEVGELAAPQRQRPGREQKRGRDPTRDVFITTNLSSSIYHSSSTTMFNSEKPAVHALLQGNAAFPPDALSNAASYRPFSVVSGVSALLFERKETVGNCGSRYNSDQSQAAQRANFTRRASCPHNEQMVVKHHTTPHRTPSNCSSSTCFSVILWIPNVTLPAIGIRTGASVLLAHVLDPDAQRTASWNLYNRSTLLLDPLYRGKYRASSDSPPVNQLPAISWERTAHLYGQLSSELLQEEISVESLYLLLQELRTAAHRNVALRRLFWKSSEVCVFLLQTLEESLHGCQSLSGVHTADQLLCTRNRVAVRRKACMYASQERPDSHEQFLSEELAENRCSSADNFLSVGWILRVLQPHPHLTSFIDYQAQQVVLVLSDLQESILSPAQSVLLFQRCRLLLACLQYNNQLAQHLRSHLREEFRYFVKLSCAEEKLPRHYPISQPTLRLIERILTLHTNTL
ncbi:uncharacterized protein C12orf56 homolog [Morone saxatilis]|uniref:uncharacterized protein C12orf56 homolog n=1 Tax=Morone saxatilis TaxID=34816 RepID=UPI0015E2438B|nr:uncharacterized protein C12orf56 homolog [Morone saxatilis]